MKECDINEFFAKGGRVTVGKPAHAKGSNLLNRWSHQRSIERVQGLKHKRDVEAKNMSLNKGKKKRQSARSKKRKKALAEATKNTNP